MTTQRGIYLPKGACLGWDASQIWAQTSADILMVCASLILPVVIFYVLRHRPSVRADPTMKRIYWAYIALILVGGLERSTNVSVMWWPVYEWQTWIKWLSAFVISGSVAVIASTLPSGLRGREQAMGAAMARGDELFKQLKEHREAFIKSREAIALDITGLEELLQQEQQTPGTVTVDQLVKGIHEVILELREHLNVG